MPLLSSHCPRLCVIFFLFRFLYGLYGCLHHVLFVTLDIDGILTERDLKSNKMELVLLIIFFLQKLTTFFVCCFLSLH